MKSRTLFWTLSFVCLASAAHATSYTWAAVTTGSSTWNSKAHWGGNGIPTAGDTAIFPATCTNLTITDSVNLGAIAGGQLSISPAKGAKVHLTGTITGVSGVIVVGGGGELFFDNEANDYTGKTTIGNGSTLHVKKVANIGETSSIGAPTGDNATIDWQGGRIYVYGGEQTCNRPNGGKSNSYWCGGASTLNLHVTGPNALAASSRGMLGQIHIEQAVTGGVTRTDGGALYLDNAANKLTGISSSQGWIYFTNFVENATSITVGQNDGSAGRIVYRGSSDVTCNKLTVSATGEFSNYTPGTTVTFTGVVAASLNANWAAYGSRLLVNGAGDVTIDQGLVAVHKLTKQNSGELTLNGQNASTNDCAVNAGTLRINGSWTSAQAGKTITVLSAATLAGAGSIGTAITLNGTLAPGKKNEIGEMTNTGTLTFGTGSRLKIRVSETSGADKLNSTGILVLNGNVSVDGAAFSGTTIKPGTYRIASWTTKSGAGSFVLGSGLPDAAHLEEDSGALDLVVPSGVLVDYVWQGDGTQNAWDTTSLNFLKGTVKSAYIESDLSRVTFDDTGSNTPEINMTRDVAPYATVVNNKTKAYAFKGAGGFSGSMTLLKLGEGLMTLKTSARNKSTILGGGTFSLEGSLVNNNVVVSNGAIFCQQPGSTISGSTSFTFLNAGVNVFNGANTFTGSILHTPVASTSFAYIAASNSAAFGSAPEILLKGNNASNLSGITLSDGVQITGPTLVIGTPGIGRPGLSTSGPNMTMSAAWYGDIRSESTSSSLPLYLTAAGSDKSHIHTMIVGKEDGSSTISGACSINVRGYYSVVRLNSRVNITSTLLRNDGGTMVLAHANNVYSDLNVIEGTLQFAVPHAAYSNAVMSIGRSGNYHVTVDLMGNDQEIAGISQSGDAKCTRELKTDSEKPATLTLYTPTGKSYTFGNSTIVNEQINGPITIIKRGPGTQIFGQEFSMSGDLRVENGVLDLACPNTFTNAASVTVAGGTLRVSAEDPLGAGIMDITQTGGTIDLQVALPNGITVDHYYVDGKMRESGEWGARGSGAPHESDYLTGPGRLFVRRGRGTTLKIR